MKEINNIVLVGKNTHIPNLYEMFEEYFPFARVNANFDASLVAAIGATKYARDWICSNVE